MIKLKYTYIIVFTMKFIIALLQIGIPPKKRLPPTAAFSNCPFYGNSVRIVNAGVRNKRGIPFYY